MMSPIALSSQMVGESLDEIDKLRGRSMEIGNVQLECRHILQAVVFNLM